MTKEITLVLMGVAVGTFISLDNIASITILASKYGTDVKLLISEIWTHIMLVVGGWYIGYIFMAYRDTFSYIAAFVLFIMGANTLYKGLFSKSKEERYKKKTLWENNRKKEMKFIFIFFPTTVGLLLIFVYLLSIWLSFTSILTGLIFAIGTMIIVAFSLLLSIKFSMK